MIVAKRYDEELRKIFSYFIRNFKLFNITFNCSLKDRTGVNPTKEI